MRRLLRERGLALVALLLALVGLASGTGGSHVATVDVVVASRSLPASTVVQRTSLRVVSIDARDRTPGMVVRVGDVVGRIARVQVSRGDYVLHTAVADASTSMELGPGERCR
jgi:flagella basal body P-ring formation protein FlgA